MYILMLRKLQDKVEDKILIVPRVYTNKPRTTGDGYRRYDYSTAISLFNSVINLVLIITVNKISSKVSETSLW